MESYTEEEKKKIEERLKTSDEHWYGVYLIVLIVITGIYSAVIGSFISFSSSWLIPALIIRLVLAIGVFCLFWLWIADLIRRGRKANK